MKTRQSGFALIAVLIVLAIAALVAEETVRVGTALSRRDAETQLLKIGQSYKKAIAMYSAGGIGGISAYPKTLQDLTRDPRSPTVKRYIRTVYLDPITKSSNWGLIYGPQGGIVGVYSRSNAAPLKSSGFPESLKFFDDATKYSDWIFTVIPIEEARKQVGVTPPGIN